LWIYFEILYVVIPAPTDPPKGGSPLSSLLDLRRVVHQTLEDIQKAAIADSAEIGRKIQKTFNQVARTVKETIKRARAQGTRLTTDARDEISRSVIKLFESVKDLVKDDLEQLTLEAQGTIKTIYTTGLAAAKSVVANFKTRRLRFASSFKQ